MDDGADVGLVDAHAKRIGGDDDRHGAGHEGILSLGSVLCALAAVVGRRRDAFASEQRVQCVDMAHRGRVDDGGTGRPRTRSMSWRCLSASLETGRTWYDRFGR